MGWAFIIFCCLVSHSRAETSSTTVEFLKKLNGYYYCLSRAGLSNYSCDLTCALTPKAVTELTGRRAYDPKVWKGVEAFKISVVDVSGVPISILGITPPSTGDAALDAKVSQLDNDVFEAAQSFFQAWKGLVMEPLNDPSDANQGNLKFARSEDGFQVVQTDPAGEITAGVFDKKGKLLVLDSGIGQAKSEILPNFIYSVKGYLLRSLKITAPLGSLSCVIDYGVQGKFWMPKTLDIQVQTPEIPNANIELFFKVSNYQINQ